MKLGRLLAPITTERTSIALLLQLIVVSIRVKSSCIEEDCADPAIKVINSSSGECVTCFRCSPCPEGQRLSVACPSTVLEGTDIHCVPMVPTDPFSLSISRASAYATDVFFTLLASPSLISLYSSPTGTRQITETAVTYSHIHNQPSVSATGSTGSHSSMTVASLETKEGDDSETRQDSKVTVATLSGCGVALIFTIVAIVYMLKKRGSTTICFPCNSNEEARPDLTSGSGDSESCSVLLSAEDDTALYVNQKLKDATCQENDSQPLQHIGQTLSDDGTIPPSLDDCSLGDGIIITNCQQNATSEGETGSDVAGSLQDPALVASPEKPSSLNIDLKPIAVPPYTCITSTPKCSVNINFIQTPGAFHDIFSLDSWHVNANDVHKQRLAKKWPTLSQAEKYSTKMHEVPFHLYHNVCLTLDIQRIDGKDVREFASKQGITVHECACLEQTAKIQNTTTTSIILRQTPGITVADFVNIMKEMGRQDIADLIN